MKVVLPEPAMPIQTMATGEFDELELEAPVGVCAEEADMVLGSRAVAKGCIWIEERRGSVGAICAWRVLMKCLHYVEKCSE
jgi:hypothetical protein